MDSMDKMTEQQKAEAIAKWLGAGQGDEDGIWCVDGFPLELMEEHRVRGVESLEDFMYWLASDSGTVAMIEKLREKIEPPLSTNRYKYELESAVSWTKMTLNAALQAACCELITD